MLYYTIHYIILVMLLLRLVKDDLTLNLKIIQIGILFLVLLAGKHSLHPISTVFESKATF